MVQITEELANELIDWLDVDLDNTVMTMMLTNVKK